MEAHEYIEKDLKKKKIKEIEDDLRSRANADIRDFIGKASAWGFQKGIKFGFFLGLFVAWFIYLILK